MSTFIIIDPALPNPFLRIGQDQNDFDETRSLEASSNDLLKHLNDLSTKYKIDFSTALFFINFGPGSYTGLKQSKILAEVFQSYGSMVCVFKQDSLLSITPDNIRAFMSPAYKGQLYITEKKLDESLEQSLISSGDWEQFCLKGNFRSSNVLSIAPNVKGITSSDFFYTLAELYCKITLEQLRKISSEYNGQELSYYRLVTDDYKATFNS